MLDYLHQDEWEVEAGAMQSPINILTQHCKKVKASTSREIRLAYLPNVEKIEVGFYNHIFGSMGKAHIWSREYDLVQYHFHAPSEHQIDGKEFAMEGHFVHIGTNGQMAVIGVLMSLGQANSAFEEMLQDLENEKTDLVEHLMNLFPENKNYYHYLGSLTTPPLTEIVEWYVFKEPVEISKDQLNRFTAVHNHNNRGLQELHNRTVIEIV